MCVKILLIFRNCRKERKKEREREKERRKEIKKEKKKKKKKETTTENKLFSTKTYSSFILLPKHDEQDVISKM